MSQAWVVGVALLLGCGGDEFHGDAGPAERCGPTGGGPYWVLEGDPLEVTASCETGLLVGGDDFDFEGLPDGARYDAATATVSWTPRLDQAVMSDWAIRYGDEVGRVRVGVVDRWDDPENVPVVDSARYQEEYGLPVFHLTTDPGIAGDAYTPATLVHRAHTYEIEAKLRGASSLSYPKHSFTLDFPPDDRFDEPRWDFENEDRIVLVSTFDDNSYVRQRLAYTLWNLLDPQHLQVRSYSAVLFLDGEYHGLYSVVEHVDRHLAEDHGMSEDDVNIYMAVNHDANFRLTRSEDGAPKGDLAEGYEKKDGPLGFEDDYTDLVSLVEFVATTGDAEFATEIGSRVDLRDYEDWWIFVSFVDGQDSAGKNSYLIHDQSFGPWRYAPWDFNASFGQSWQTLRTGADSHPDGLTWANHLFERLLALPEFGDPLRARYGDTLRGPYEQGALLALFDEMIDEIHPSALRDEAKWGEQYRTYDGWNWRDDFVGHEEEAAYTREWIEARWEFLEGIYR